MLAATRSGPAGSAGGVDGAAHFHPPGSHLLVRWSGPAGVVRSLPDLTRLEGVTVTALPAVGVTILPGAILARLEADNSLATPDGRGLLPDTKALLEALQREVKLTPLP